MSKVAVVYWSSTGNTEAMANAVADGIREKGGEAVLHTCEDFDGSKVAEYDAIAFGCPAMGDEVLEDIVFRNIDILEHDEDDRDCQGCMTINVGDHNLAQNITFEDIRVEHIQEGQLFHLRVMYNQKYNTGPGRGVRNITFRNISCTGKYINPSLMEGYDKNRKVENILFENIMLNGKRIASLEELNIDKKDFVGKIQIK